MKASKDSDVDPEFLRAGVVKVFADGVMDTRRRPRRCFHPISTPVANRPSIRRALFRSGAFRAPSPELDAAGLTVHVHAIGDRAVRASLDAFASARAANGDKDNRHQIAHLQLVDPTDFPRFKELGVIADFQLEWAKREPATEGPLEPFLGPDRYRYLYPAGSLHKAGAMIIGGSDWDVSSYNPFGVSNRCHALRRQRAAPLNIDERIPLETAIDAYTINAAYAMKQDKTTGSLEAGKRADLVVLDPTPHDRSRDHRSDQGARHLS